MTKSLLFAIALCLACLQTSNAQYGTSLYDNSIVHEVRMTLTQKDWPNLLDSLRIHGDGLMTGKATIDGTTYDEVGISYRGGVSYQTGGQRNPFEIKLDHIRSDQNHKGNKTIKISNSLRDPSMVREVLASEIARSYMPAPGASFARMYINDEYRGLFVLVEPVDETFLNRHFGESNGTFFKCTPDLKAKPKMGCLADHFGNLRYEADQNCYEAQYKMYSNQGWDRLVELSRILTDQPEKATEMLDIDKTLWMLAFNNMFVNLSSYSGQYSQNYFLYQNQQGKFAPIIWDLNLSFGGAKNTGEGITSSVASDLDLKGLQNLDPYLHSKNPDRPLISGLLANPDFHRIYTSHMRTLLYDYVLSGKYEARAKQMQALIRPHLVDDKYKYYSLTDFDGSISKTVGTKSKIPGLTELMVARGKMLKKDPNFTPFPPTIGVPEFATREKFSSMKLSQYTIRVKVENFPKRVFVYYRVPGYVDYETYELNDEGRDGDIITGDKIYGGTLPIKDIPTIEYYLRADNAALIQYEPSQYQISQKTISLEKIN
jgi:CotH kinase protein